MAEDKSQIEQYNDAEGNGFNGTAGVALAKPTIGQRLKAHYKRWWWVHVIILIIVVLVVTLPVVYVGYPHIAQHDISDSTLNITQLMISNPTPDSFDLHQTQTLGTNSSYHPWIYSFNSTVSLAGASAPFAFIPVPKVKSKNGAEIVIDDRVQLANVSAFSDFCKATMLNEEVSLNVYGKPELKEGGLPKTKVTYNKTVTMKALNKLKGFNITELHVLTKNNPDGTNMNGTVLIPNPSVLTLEMGNLTMDLSVDGTPIGQSFIYNFTLRPGNNITPMTSKVNETVLISMLTEKYKDGILPLDIVGSESAVNGKNLTYFSEALAANTIHVNVNAGAALAEIGLSGGL
ncbi:hypothetical protein DTO027B5_3632 [Paecilomyces variotii]|nr:hypothetical protein DTO027B3_1541 [Paecilomyces variotii]KAJ9334612.1 hypothetical protein DTO027B5_3632 [Paecilomyces variotii]KAJ9348989.1 hypothetical protein DTO027B9_7892 [Paecilomyces variotii]